MKLLDFNDKVYSRNDMLIVYGTEGFGRIVHYCLKKKNIVPDYYVNNRGRGFFFGVPVIDINKLETIYQEKHPIILLAVGNASKEVILKLNSRKIDKVYSIYNLLEEVPDMGSLFDPIYDQRFSYFYQQDSFINEDKLILPSLDIVVTEKCSLRCEKCSNLMQYYHNPQNIGIKEITESLDKILNIVDGIYELRILGGEPFMNPEFYPLIDSYKDNDKIKKIVIVSNATIFPGEKELDKLKNRKVKIWLSDYDELSTKLYEWVTWCVQNSVEYMVASYTRWQDCGKLEKHNYTCNEREYVYKTCQCRDLPTLLRGNLFNCPYAANAINLGALSDSEAKEDIFSLDDKSVQKDEMKNFLFHRDYLMSCDYCDGRNFNRALIEPHRQIAKPIEYTKRSTR